MNNTSIPPSFKPLQGAYQTDPGFPLNVIGVVSDFKDAMKSQGPDWTISFVLHDPSWFEGLGLPVRFFHKVPQRLPKVTSTGDIVILRNVKNTDYRGERVSFSNSASSWVVLEYESVRDSKCENGTDIVVRRSGQAPHQAPHPNIHELRYAKFILSLEDPTRWQTPLITLRTVEDVPSAQGVTINAGYKPKEKFGLISDLAISPGHKGIFRDLFCEVRRMFESPHGDRCELFVTDYTENSSVYDYRHGLVTEDTGYDHGDRFGYVDRTYKTWPGPWGKMTLMITCWPPNASFAMKNVSPGDFVHLWNVHITYDRDVTKLEGHCRTDQLHPDKVSIQPAKRIEAETNDRFKELLRRKRDYEELCKKSHLRFIRDAKTIRPNDSNPGDDKENDPTVPKLSKKAQRRAKAREAAAATAVEAPRTVHQLPSNPFASNKNIRCNNIDIPLTTIATILDPSTLLRKTPAGNPFSLPFQNSCYKSKVRVIDFFPDNLSDFCAPIRDSEYSSLSDHESVSDIDPTQTSLINDTDVRWEWRFIILVQDAKPPLNNNNDHIPSQLELLVCGTDGDYLLREDACDLRHEPKALAKLKEKLFHLWGDLQEQKAELTGLDRFAPLKPSGRPFECFIKEYGVPGIGEQGKEDEDVTEWERMFRLCLTTISMD